MQFDLQKFYKTAEKPYSAEFCADLSGMDLPGYTLAGPARCSFCAVPTVDGIELELRVQAVIAGECARCLEPVQQECNFTREWQFTEADLKRGEYELPINAKGVLELTELVFQEILFEAPSVLLCSPDCPGLCPICGKKKAAGCSCQQAEEVAPADARLSILQQLLN